MHAMLSVRTTKNKQFFFTELGSEEIWKFTLIYCMSQPQKFAVRISLLARERCKILIQLHRNVCNPVSCSSKKNYQTIFLFPYGRKSLLFFTKTRHFLIAPSNRKITQVLSNSSLQHMFFDARNKRINSSITRGHAGRNKLIRTNIFLMKFKLSSARIAAHTTLTVVPLVNEILLRRVINIYTVASKDIPT